MPIVPYFLTSLATYNKFCRLALHEVTHISKYMKISEGGGGGIKWVFLLLDQTISKFAVNLITKV
jgi:hypothetical protein